MSVRGSDIDELFELKNNFYLGNYQGAINEGSTGLRQLVSVQKEVYMFRAFIAQGDASVVLAEVSPGRPETPAELLVVYALAQIAVGQREEAIGLLSQVSARALGASPSSDKPSESVALLLAQAYFVTGNYEEGLRYAAMSSSLEARALAIQILLAINRADLAEKEWLKMKALEEDAPLSQLALAWIYIASGGEKLREAMLIFKELSESYAATPLLLNGMAICSMQAGDYKQAETHLLASLQRNSKDPETLINLMVCSFHLNKDSPVSSEGADKRLFRSLQLSHPNHRWLQGVQNKEIIFDAVAARFAPAGPSSSSPSPSSSSSSS